MTTVPDFAQRVRERFARQPAMRLIGAGLAQASSAPHWTRPAVMPR